ncbi:MAG: hypothetical protein A3F72_08935 [Bacteroidetes bacterium RIFCSPLOWO2_12_FULL_35_15]|nr:MAG: hypothetical protein A3F72_08935 [Bacteroidetes bacterium RIFCSPLOWO2_12_FULL_35_15]
MKNNYSVFLIDNNEIDNFINQRVLKNFSESITVFAFSSDTDALEYLQKNKITPQYILLSLNYPTTNDSDFFEQYEKLDFDNKNTSIYILSTLLLPSDIEKLNTDYKHIGYIEKPLSAEKWLRVMNTRRLKAEITPF